MTARTIEAPLFDLAVIGGTGDLARRKLLPAFYQRDRAGQIPDGARVIGAARGEMDADGYRAFAREALAEFVPADERDAEATGRFLGRLDYAAVDLAAGTGWERLAGLMRPDAVRAFYLAVSPRFYADAARQARAAGALVPGARLVVEKPFGTDLASARTLNAELTAQVEEAALYRIDHYLGKETVQNLMALRFANALFEPLWNARHVDHVQITVAESVGVEASRTATFAAIKAHVDNWRWNGVPFYLRTGKRLRARMSEIIVRFREPPHSIFPERAGEARPNALRIRLQPDEGMTLDMTIKDPGPGGMRLAPAALDMSFADRLAASGFRLPDAYERLLMDVVRGDQTLFMRGDEVEAAWAWVDPILAAWEEQGAPELYDIGSAGPEGALSLVHADGRRWMEIAP